MSGRYLVGEVVHLGYRIDARDISIDAADAVRLACEKKQFMSALYGGPELLPIYVLWLHAWPAKDPIDCMTCLVMENRRGGS